MISMTSKNRQTGMTLIEIMIAMLTGVFLIGGTIQIFTSTKQTYRMQENMSRMQENARFAMEYISRDIRMADYWGCLGSSVNSVDNNLKPDPDFDDLAIGIEAQNDDNGGNDGDTDNDENGNDIWDGTDSITLREVVGTDVFVTNIPLSTSDPLMVTDGSGFTQGDILIVSDCTDGDIFQLPSIVSSDTLTHGTGNSGIPPNGNNDQFFRKIYGLDAQIYTVTSLNYSIRNGAGNQPSLFRIIDGVTSQELVEGIENMQILYGEDTDNNLTPDYFVPMGTAGLNMDQVVSIQVSLLVTSIDDNLVPQPIPYTYNNVQTTPTDRKIRRVFSSTIAVRNRLR